MERTSPSNQGRELDIDKETESATERERNNSKNTKVHHRDLKINQKEANDPSVIANIVKAQGVIVTATIQLQTDQE